MVERHPFVKDLAVQELFLMAPLSETGRIIHFRMGARRVFAGYHRDDFIRRGKFPANIVA
jgi:hypothetical protein